MGIRSFLAFELPAGIQERLGIVSMELRKAGLPVRWVKIENIHLTIVFLGSVDNLVLEAVKEKAGTVVEDLSTIKIGLRGIGAFPHWRRPKVMWAGLNGDIEKLSRLRNTLNDELGLLGFKAEKRPYRPHLTLGRFKGPVKRNEDLRLIIDTYQDMVSEVYELNELVLFKSDLKPDGPVYTKMAAWPLKVG